MVYTYDHSPRGSVVLASHLRRRSSISLSTANSSPQPIHAPFVSHLIYDDKTGEISLPPSPPPLIPWKEKNALGLIEDEKRGRLPFHGRAGVKGKPFRMPRPWMSVASLTGVTVAFIWLMTYLVPASSDYTTAPFLNHLRSPSAPHCDPYNTPGSLQTDSTNPDHNQWRPFDSSCQPPQLLARLRQSLHLADGSRAGPPPSLNEFSWMRNKTALLIGDAVSREHVDNLCQLLGEESEVLRPGHRFAPRPAAARAAVKAEHGVKRPERLAARGFKTVKDVARPRMCYIPSLDFLLVSTMHFGLDQEDYFYSHQLPHYSSPGQFEHRLTDLVQPLVNQLRAQGRRSAPDFVELSSGAWDLARWAEQDLAAGADPAQPLAGDRVTWYRFRAGQAMDKVRSAFPGAKALTWRTQHYPLSDARERVYFQDKILSKKTEAAAGGDTAPPHFAHSRIAQLDAAIRSLVLPSPASAGSVVMKAAPHGEFRLNRWGELLKGHEAHQKDRLHGDPLPGGYVWADVMLYEMRRGVSMADARPFRGQ